MDWEVGFRTKIKQKLRINNALARECLAELIGTFVLILLGDGSVAQSVLSGKEAGTFLTINWAWGLAVAMGVWISGGVSGGHINPAVSLAMVVLGRLPVYKFPFYMVAQYLGAFGASAVVYGVYFDALKNFDGGNRTVLGATGTAGIWATYPKPYLNIGSGFADQVVGTAVLLGCVLAITDEKNMKPPKGMVPFAIGLVVAVIGMALGVNCGYAINPARDLAPRIFTAIAGWGTGVFSIREYRWFWVPVLATHIGAVVGAWVYLLFVGIHFPDEEEDVREIDQTYYNTSTYKPKTDIELEPTLKQGETFKVPAPDYS